MTTMTDIFAAYDAAHNYPDLAKKLAALGIFSYTVDVATETMLYRLSDGHHLIHQPSAALRNISDAFDEAGTIQAIRDSQQKKINYPQFLDAIALSGITMYEATLDGNRKRVTYMGAGGYYEEEIPV